MTENRAHGIQEKCEVVEKPVCYEECGHRDDVYSEMYGLGVVGGDRKDKINQWLESLLYSDELTIQELCAWAPDVCLAADAAGFSCVQCVVYEPAFAMCGPEEFDCEGQCYRAIDPCSSFCAPVCNTYCRTKAVDWSQDAELLLYLEAIISAINTIDARPNWASIDLFAKAIFGAGASVVKYANRVYYVFVGSLTDAVKNALVSIANVFPVPLGTSIKFVETC